MAYNINDGPVVIVTGAARGIGKATAIKFAGFGYRVMAFDRDAAALVATIADGLASLPVVGKPGDVSNPSDVNAAIEECASQLGGIDVLVNNVGIIEETPFLDITEEQWDRTMAANLKGMFLFGQAAARWMVENNRPGCIINIGCMRSDLVAPGLAAYAASKGGVTSLTKAMAVELGPHGIRVNAIQPGRTLTDTGMKFFADLEIRKSLEVLVPLGHLADPEDIANAALFLASDCASYINGAILPVDGGYLVGKG